MLQAEINEAQRLVKTDAYQMSVGEIVSLYEDNELIIDPNFQRLFRWDIGQKSKLIESLLLGIPLPPIFVFEKDNGAWELIDGLQRISTILEFMGELKASEGGLMPPSVLESTKYLGSLHNVVWEKSDRIDSCSIDDQIELDKAHKLSIRRARVGVEILKRPSSEKTKFDLFQRLNAGGTLANAQELRNCVMIMMDSEYFSKIKRISEDVAFKEVLSLTDEQLEKQRHIEMAVRIMVHAAIPYDGKLDVEEYIDSGIATIISGEDKENIFENFSNTIDLLYKAGGKIILRRVSEDGVAIGRNGLVGLEVIAVGVMSNISEILKLSNPEVFVKDKAGSVWREEQIKTFTSPGLRGTSRIRKTVPFGQKWFKP